MSRESIYLAGWLTTAVVAVVVMFGIANGAFGMGRETEPAPQALTAPYAEPQISTVQGTTPQMGALNNTNGVSSSVDRPMGAEARPTGDQLASPTVVNPTNGQTPQIEYVYPDGSPAPAPTEAVAPLERGREGHDDDDDEHEEHHEHDDDDDEHDDDDDDDGLEGLLHWVFERDDD